jgi:hypothetical protein
MKRRRDTSSAPEKNPINALVRDTVAELKKVRGDDEATKSALWQYFRQGRAAKLTVEELDERLPEMFAKLKYSADQQMRVLSTIRGLYAINFGEMPTVRVESNESISVSETTDSAVENTENIEDGANIEVAEEFGKLIAEEDYVAAHHLLTRAAQKVHSPAKLKKAVKTITAYDPGPIREVEVMTDMILYDWPDKEPGDLAWVYVSLVGDSYVEAVSLVLVEEVDATRIRQLEWGRP